MSGSNPRSPRRTIAITKWIQLRPDEPVPILDRPEERSQFKQVLESDVLGLFQSSIAPKNDRNCHCRMDLRAIPQFQSSIAPKNDRNRWMRYIDRSR